MNDKISIIVPVYNAEKYLRKCLDSLINQTYENIEIICVNDESPDDSLTILQEYAERDSRIKVINQQNAGASEARNTGLRFVTGDYVMFLDSDDWIDVDTCSVAMENMKKYNVDVVMWSYVREYAEKSVKKIIYSEDVLFESEEDVQNLHIGFAGPVEGALKNPENADAFSTVWGKLYKKSVIADTKFIDVREIGSHEDGLFNLYVFKNVKSAFFVNKCFNHYRKDNVSSLTSSYNAKLYERRQRIYGYIKEYIDDNGLDGRYIRALNNRVVFEILYLGLNEINSSKKGIEKRKMLKTFVKSEGYVNACRGFSAGCFPLQWKLFFFLAEKRCVFGLYLMLNAIQMLRKR